jgi:hypothetical protein
MQKQCYVLLITIDHVHIEDGIPFWKVYVQSKSLVLNVIQSLHFLFKIYARSDETFVHRKLWYLKWNITTKKTQYGLHEGLNTTLNWYAIIIFAKSTHQHASLWTWMFCMTPLHDKNLFFVTKARFRPPPNTENWPEQILPKHLHGSSLQCCHTISHKQHSTLGPYYIYGTVPLQSYM